MSEQGEEIGDGAESGPNAERSQMNKMTRMEVRWERGCTVD